MPSSRDLLNPGIEPGSPALQAGSLPSELCLECVARIQVDVKDSPHLGMRMLALPSIQHSI